MQVLDFELSTGKMVTMKFPRIKHFNTANDVAIHKSPAGKSPSGFAVQMELVKLLVMEVNGKAVSSVERENLDDIFDLGEYTEISEELGTMLGKSGKAKVTVRTISNS